MIKYYPWPKLAAYSIKPDGVWFKFDYLYGRYWVGNAFHAVAEANETIHSTSLIYMNDCYMVAIGDKT